MLAGILINLALLKIVSAGPCPSSGGSPTLGYHEPTPLPSPASWGKHKVLGYYGDDEAQFLAPSAVPWSHLTHISFAFGSIGSDYTVNITTEESLMSNVFSTALNHGVKPLLAVGGWGPGSEMYSAMVSNKTTRAKFIRSLHPLVTKYAMAGLDICWEYPGRASDGIVPFNATGDFPNLVLFLQELRAAFDSATFSVSAAVAGVTPFAKDVSEIASHLDWASVMEYDFATGILDQTTADAPLKGSLSGQSGIEAWVTAGMPTTKMIYAIPSYGRSFTLTDVPPLAVILI